MKKIFYLLIVIASLNSCGSDFNTDTEIKKQLIEYKKVGLGGNNEFITLDTIESIDDIDGSIIRMKTKIVSDLDTFIVTIFKDGLVVLPISETN